MNNKLRDTIITAALIIMCGLIIFSIVLISKSKSNMLSNESAKKVQCIDGKLYIMYEHMPFRTTKAPVYNSKGNHLHCKE